MAAAMHAEIPTKVCQNDGIAVRTSHVQRKFRTLTF